MPAEEACFRVVYSDKVKEELRAILRKAKKVDNLDRMAQAALEMDHRLSTDPLGFGELVGTLHWMKLPIHVGFVRPLKVDFAIHEHRRIVFVKKITEFADLKNP